MNRRFDIWLVALFTGGVLRCAVAGAAEDGVAPSNSSAPAGLQMRATILSSDNVFAISAPPVSMGFRGPVLYFVDQFRREFQRATKLEIGHLRYPITLLLGSSTNDLRVVGSCTAAVDGGVQEWIEIPDPDHASFDLLRAALAQAMVREWLRALPAPAARDNPPPQAPPAWLVTGLARHIGAGSRPQDFDSVHAQWRSGRLPLLADLLSAEPPAALQAPALQAVLADWLLDHPGEPLVALLRRLAGGTPWSATLVAETLYAHKKSVSLNEVWDLWQARAIREIRQVGVTTPGLVRMFREQLLIYPGDHALPMTEAWRGRTLEEALAWPITPAVKEALHNKARAIRMFSAGRDGALQRVTVAYAEILDAMAAGEANDKLRTMLARAEDERRQLEARAEHGELLRDPVAVTAPAGNQKKK